MAHKTAIIKLVSGMEVEMRELLLADESDLAKSRSGDRSLATRTLFQVMENCTVSVVSPGPYASLGGKINWEKVLTGDFLDAMLQLRVLSYSEGDKLQVPDIRCPSCRAKFTWEVDIVKDLRRQVLSAQSFEAIKSSTPLSVEVNGSKVLFKLPTGETESLYRKLSKQYLGRDMASGLRSRIVDVVDADGTKVERRDLMDWLDGGEVGKSKYPGLTSADAELIRDAMDKQDAGVDLQVAATCPEPDCGQAVYFDLPFDKIFLPGASIQRRKMERRQPPKEESLED